MGYVKVTGIVTRYVNYKDYDRIISIFTRESGRIDAKARGCRRPKSPLLPCAQPFVYGEFQLFAGKEHYTVDQCDIKESFYPLREDMDKLAAASAMVAVTQAVVQQDEANEPLFYTLYHALSFLCYGGGEPLDVAICFFVKLLREAGVCPSITACAACGADVRGAKNIFFSARAGGALCGDCAGGARAVRHISLEAMRRMLLLDDEDIWKVKLPAPVRAELIQLLKDYVEYTLDRPITALQALRA